jgi:hypothetical protein
MYDQVNVSIYNRIKLYDAIRECFRNNIAGGFRIVISERGDERFLLTTRHQQQLRENGGIAVITCYHDQIIQYAHNCVSKPKLMRILSGENPM